MRYSLWQAKKTASPIQCRLNAIKFIEDELDISVHHDTSPPQKSLISRHNPMSIEFYASGLRNLMQKPSSEIFYSCTVAYRFLNHHTCTSLHNMYRQSKQLNTAKAHVVKSKDLHLFVRVLYKILKPHWRQRTGSPPLIMFRAPQSPQRYSTPRMAGRPVPGVAPAGPAVDVFILYSRESIRSQVL